MLLKIGVIKWISFCRFGKVNSQYFHCMYRNVHNQSSLASSELWLGKISNVILPHLHSGLPSAAYCSRPVGRSTCPVLQRISRPSQDITRLSNALQQIHSGIPSPFRSSVQVNWFFHILSNPSESAKFFLYHHCPKPFTVHVSASTSIDTYIY